MSSAAITTVNKMIESLPPSMQEVVIYRLREIITEVQDEVVWEEIFERTSDKLAKAGQQAKKEIDEGRAKPMNYGKL